MFKIACDVSIFSWLILYQIRASKTTILKLRIKFGSDWTNEHNWNGSPINIQKLTIIRSDDQKRLDFER